MRSVGELLKQARIRKKYSLGKLERKTRIKKEFISSIEQGEWEKLPSFPTVLGFVRSLATPLGVSTKQAVAVLKRDYPPVNASINPKPDVEDRFAWSPKLTFALGVGVVLVAILGYLTFQYIRFISPPSLRVESPGNEQVVATGSVLVSGTTDPDAKVIIDNQPVIVDENGNFSVLLSVISETKEVAVKAISRSGKETMIYRSIVVESN